jgi:hypothetical protein
MPIAFTRRVKTCPYAPSLSRTRYAGAEAQGNASVICRANHAAVGCRVTSNHSSCRRPWPNTRNANKRSKVSVGTTHISIAVIASAWFERNVFQLCEGGVPPRTMYLETVDWATSNPSIRSSPWIRDAPHCGFSLLIRWMRSRRPRSIFGRPTRFRDFQRQKALKPARCHRRIVSG